MVSACITCYGASKPFFVSSKGLKVNSERYKKWNGAEDKNKKSLAWSIE